MWRRLLLILALLVVVSALALVLVARHSWHGETPLHLAAWYDHPTWARVWLLVGVDVDARDNDVWGRTPLHLAAYCGQLDVARVLLDHGADPNAVSGGRPELTYVLPGTTPLYMAIDRGHPDVAQLLLSRGARHTLHTAAAMGDLAAVRRLLDAGADVDAHAPMGQTALFFAVAYNHSDAIRLLLRRGADPFASAEDPTVLGSVLESIGDADPTMRKSLRARLAAKR